MPINQDLWDLFVKFEENKERATEKAKEICVEFLGNKWSQEKFEIAKLSGGIMNLVFKCTIPSDPKPEFVLLRIQCDKDVMQLQNELIVLMKLAENRLGPKLLGVFPGGRLEEFIPSRMLTYDEAKTPGYSQQIAKTMAKIHQVDVPLPKTSRITATMREWLKKIEENGGQEFQLWSKIAKIPKNRFPHKIDLTEIAKQIDDIEIYLKKCSSPCRLTHNDLYATNILLRDGYTIGENGQVVCEDSMVATIEDPLVIIDFEFGMYNYRGFDIGNHLNELGIIYFEEMPTYSIDLEKLEDRSLHKNYCTAYIEETYARLAKKCLNVDYEQLSGNLAKDVVALEKEAVTFQAIANFWWALWSIICDQEGSSGMDFHNVWRDRMCLYYYLKNF